MRKIIAVCLMVVMLSSLMLSVFAAPGGFIQSISGNLAPELIEGENATEDCSAELVITAYIDRDELPEELRLQIEEAYRLILENEDLSVLNEKLKDYADELGVEVTDLAVSDLFDIHYINCDDHEGHGYFDITLKAETLENFVCLLHYYNGEWRIVDDAKVTNDTHLEFTATEFSPFAIVVNTGEPNPDAPQTNDMFTVYIAVAAISGLMLLGLAVAYKKTKA